MRRRDFITLLGGAAASWPLAARAQQSARPTLGYLSSESRGMAELHLAGFRQGLKDTGFIEGQNVAIEYRWAENQNDRLPGLVAEIVRRRVAVIVAHDTPSTLAAKGTTTVPIVFVTGTDPVALGLVPSFNRPAGNITGVSFLAGRLGSKRLSLLHDIVPETATVAILVDPSAPTHEAQINEAKEAARALGFDLAVLKAGTEREIDLAFATLVERGIRALLVGASAQFDSWRDQIVALAARHAIPAIYPDRANVSVGGLISYGTSIADAHRLAGVYAGRILKGAKPAELPIQQSTKFELVINLKTAKALGLAIPSGVLAIADEVIE